MILFGQGFLWFLVHSHGNAIERILIQNYKIMVHMFRSENNLRLWLVQNLYFRNVKTQIQETWDLFRATKFSRLTTEPMVTTPDSYTKALLILPASNTIDMVLQLLYEFYVLKLLIPAYIKRHCNQARKKPFSP